MRTLLASLALCLIAAGCGATTEPEPAAEAVEPATATAPATTAEPVTSPVEPATTGEPSARRPPVGSLVLNPGERLDDLLHLRVTVASEQGIVEHEEWFSPGTGFYGAVVGGRVFAYDGTTLSRYSADLGGMEEVVGPDGALDGLAQPNVYTLPGAVYVDEYLDGRMRAGDEDSGFTLEAGEVDGRTQLTVQLAIGYDTHTAHATIGIVVDDRIPLAYGRAKGLLEPDPEPSERRRIGAPDDPSEDTPGYWLGWWPSDARALLSIHHVGPEGRWHEVIYGRPGVGACPLGRREAVGTHGYWPLAGALQCDEFTVTTRPAGADVPAAGPGSGVTTTRIRLADGTPAELVEQESQARVWVRTADAVVEIGTGLDGDGRARAEALLPLRQVAAPTVEPDDEPASDPPATAAPDVEQPPATGDGLVLPAGDRSLAASGDAVRLHVEVGDHLWDEWYSPGADLFGAQLPGRDGADLVMAFDGKRLAYLDDDAGPTLATGPRAYLSGLARGTPWLLLGRDALDRHLGAVPRGEDYAIESGVAGGHTVLKVTLGGRGGRTSRATVTVAERVPLEEAAGRGAFEVEPEPLTGRRQVPTEVVLTVEAPGTAVVDGAIAYWLGPAWKGRQALLVRHRTTRDGTTYEVQYGNPDAKDCPLRGGPVGTGGYWPLLESDSIPYRVKCDGIVVTTAPREQPGGAAGTLQRTGGGDNWTQLEDATTQVRVIGADHQAAAAALRRLGG